MKAQGGQHATLKGDTKAAVIKATRDFASGKEISVKIYTQDGKIQEERTYIKSSDPKKSEGLKTQDI